MLAPPTTTGRRPARAAVGLGLALALLGCERPAEEPAAPAEPAEAEPRASEESEPPPPSNEPATAPDEPAASSIAWTLKAEPASFSLADLDEVRLRLEARNTGTETVDPPHPWDFRVDGAPSMALSLSFGNGATGPKWRTLPPGQRAVDSRVGVSFVDTAGEHVISVHEGDRELARVVVQVQAR